MGEANINLSVATPAFKPLGTVEPAVESERRPDGSIILRDPRPPVPPERTIVAYLRLWADETPDRPILAQRSARGGWHKVSYSDMRRDADAAAQWLLDQGIAPGQSILILSPASLDHATLLFAALTVGITVVPVSPPYALQRTGWSKLRKVLDAVRPAAVFSQTAAPYADAVEAADLSHLPWMRRPLG
jgi:feruloyl-CoA synthase